MGATLPTPDEVVAQRRRRRTELLDQAAAFARDLDGSLGVQAVVVVGSVARGDFGDHSDIDVLVVAEHLPARYADRLAALGWPGDSLVEPIAWTPDEYARRRARREAISLEAETDGVWLVGSPAQLTTDR